jgi:hypothetical protein
MTHHRRFLVGALGLSLALAACGSSTASPAATTAPSAAAPATPAPTQATVPTEAPTASEDAGATEAPTDDAGTPSGTPSGPLTDLAKLLPEQAGGATFTRVGFDGSQLGIYGAAAGLNSSELDPILKANGKTLNDVNFAFASSASGASVGGMIYAIQINGLKAADLMAAMNLDPKDMTQTTLAGKTVFAQGAAAFGVWAYPKDDKLFVILLTTEDVATAILQELP